MPLAWTRTSRPWPPGPGGGPELLDRGPDVRPRRLAVPRRHAGVLGPRARGGEGGLHPRRGGGELRAEGGAVGGVDVLGGVSPREPGGVVVKVALAPGEGELRAGLIWEGPGQGGGYGGVPV